MLNINKNKLFWTLVYVVFIGSVFASLFFVQSKLNQINKKYDVSQKRLDSIQYKFVVILNELRKVKPNSEEGLKKSEIESKRDTTNFSINKTSIPAISGAESTSTLPVANNVSYIEDKLVGNSDKISSNSIPNVELGKKTNNFSHNYSIFSTDSSYLFCFLAPIENSLKMKKNSSFTSFEERMAEHFISNFYIGILDKKSLIKYSSISSLEIVGINHDRNSVILNAYNNTLYESKAAVTFPSVESTSLNADRYIIFPVKVFEGDNTEARRIMGENLKKYYINRRLILKLIELNNHR